MYIFVVPVFIQVALNKSLVHAFPFPFDCTFHSLPYFIDHVNLDVRNYCDISYARLVIILYMLPHPLCNTPKEVFKEIK